MVPCDGTTRQTRTGFATRRFPGSGTCTGWPRGDPGHRCLQSRCRRPGPEARGLLTVAVQGRGRIDALKFTAHQEIILQKSSHKVPRSLLRHRRLATVFAGAASTEATAAQDASIRLTQRTLHMDAMHLSFAEKHGFFFSETEHGWREAYLFFRGRFWGGLGTDRACGRTVRGRSAAGRLRRRRCSSW